MAVEYIVGDNIASEKDNNTNIVEIGAINSSQTSTIEVGVNDSNDNKSSVSGLLLFFGCISILGFLITLLVGEISKKLELFTARPSSLKNGIVFQILESSWIKIF